MSFISAMPLSEICKAKPIILNSTAMKGSVLSGSKLGAYLQPHQRSSPTMVGCPCNMSAWGHPQIELEPVVGSRPCVYGPEINQIRTFRAARLHDHNELRRSRFRPSRALTSSHFCKYSYGMNVPYDRGRAFFLRLFKIQRNKKK